MSDEKFWNIVDETGSVESNLQRALESLPTDELVAFQTTLDRKMAAAYSWDLWGAAFVIHGGASDDGFEYFRGWLVSRGRATYEAALADPDSLAARIPADAAGALEFEEFGHIGFRVWTKRTGLGPKQFPNAVAARDEPSGKPFEEDEAELSVRYPKLWVRFGDSPLG